MITPLDHKKIAHKGKSDACAVLHGMGGSPDGEELAASYGEGLVNGVAEYLVVTRGENAALEALARSVERIVRPEPAERRISP